MISERPSAPTIVFDAVSKRYLVPHRRDAWGKGTLVSDLASRLARRFRANAATHDELWALSDVSFSVGRGEVVGLIGKNGAGKSTLLKLLTRITEPTSGRIEVRGGVTSLLEVGTGFHPDLTGRENVFLYGAILGMDKATVRSRFDAIVAFSGLERFLDLPIKRWSSGMALRLAFSVATHLEHRILLVDEALSVGDAAFRAQCLSRLEVAARDEGRTILFVSHELTQIRRLAPRSILLDRGRLVADGPTGTILGTYLTALAETTSASSTGAALVRPSLIDARGRPIPSVPSGSHATLSFELDLPEAGLLELDLETAWGTRLASLALPAAAGQSLRRVSFPQLLLGPGPHRVALTLRGASGHELARYPEAMTFVVTPTNTMTTEGLVALPVELDDQAQAR